MDNNLNFEQIEENKDLIAETTYNRIKTYFLKKSKRIF